MARFVISSETVEQAMRSKAVRSKLQRTAARIAARHDALAASDGSDKRAHLEDGIRPRGRPFVNVVVDGGAADEWGDSKTERRRRLGRASNT